MKAIEKAYCAVLLSLSLCWGLACQADTEPLDGPPVAEILESLHGLGAEEFFAESFKQILLRSPESITEMGLAETYGLGNDQLDNLSDTYLRDSEQLESGILDLLRDYDRNSLTEAEQLTYDIYEWKLDDWVRGHAFRYYDYPVNHMTFGVQNWTLVFFSDIHPVRNQQEAEGYVSRLWQVDDKFDQVMAGLRLREDMGVVPPRLIIQWTLYGVNNIANAPARDLPLYTAFEEKLAALSSLDAQMRTRLLAEALDAIEGAVLPAYQDLADFLQRQENLAPTDEGVWQFDQGDAYYAHMLRWRTTTDLSADAIHQLGLEEVARIRAEMQLLFDQLGYPSDLTLAAYFTKVIEDGGSVAGSEVLDEYRSLIETASANLEAAFDIQPQTQVEVVGDASGGFYVRGSLDGSRTGAFYANDSGAPEPRYGMPTLAYHEAVPGHHFQITIAQEQDVPLLRKVLSFTAFAEGWALYAERLAFELGWYQDDPYGDLGRLQAEIFRAARLVVDTGIHAKKWTYDQALRYMRDNTGFDAEVVNLEWEVARYMVMPAQATAYKIGMLRLLQIRQTNQEQLGAQYNLVDFHRPILVNGAMPLDLLAQLLAGG